MATPQKIYAYETAVQYDGTNGEQVRTLVGNDFTIISDDGQIMHYTSCGNDSRENVPPITNGDWVRYGPGYVKEVMSPEAYESGWLSAGPLE